MKVQRGITSSIKDVLKVHSFLEALQATVTDTVLFGIWYTTDFSNLLFIFLTVCVNSFLKLLMLYKHIFSSFVHILKFLH